MEHHSPKQGAAKKGKVRTSPSQAVTLGKNPERTRDHNRRVVLDTIRKHGSLGRMEIARLTHLTAQSITNIVDELVAENLLMPMGRLRRGRGLPPLQFKVNPDGAMTIGVELASDTMVTSVLDLAGNPLRQTVQPLIDTQPAILSRQLRTEVDAIKATFPAKLLGIGIVMPGPFDIEGMTSVGPTTLPGWDGLNPAAVLSEACAEAVMVENDATAAAVAEGLFGAGQSIGNFAMIYFGAGIGMGMVQDGAPYRGAFGNAGEIGHIGLVPDGRLCACGQKGCLETYASLHALRQRLTAAGHPQSGFPDLENFYREANPDLMAWLEEAAMHLSTMTGMIENILDPETIILGGMLPEVIIDGLIDHMQQLPLSVAGRRTRSLPRLMRGQTGQFTASLGAAAMPMFDALMPKLDTSLEP